MPVSRTAPRAEAFIEEEDEFSLDSRPKNSGSKKSSKGAEPTMESGWEAADSLYTAPDFPEDFKETEDQQLIKFIDKNGPFASYRQHFLKKKDGRKSYVCLSEGCPLCGIGDKPEDKRAFTIVNFSANPPVRQMIIASPNLYKSLHAGQHSPQGPLEKPFWGLCKSGAKQSTKHHLTPVKVRDLDEDWGLNPEDVAEQLSKFEPFTRDDIKITSYDDLVDIAEDLE